MIFKNHIRLLCPLFFFFFLLLRIQMQHFAIFPFYLEGISCSDIFQFFWNFTWSSVKFFCYALLFSNIHRVEGFTQVTVNHILKQKILPKVRKPPILALQKKKAIIQATLCICIVSSCPYTTRTYSSYKWKSSHLKLIQRKREKKSSHVHVTTKDDSDQLQNWSCDISLPSVAWIHRLFFLC